MVKTAKDISFHFLTQGALPAVAPVEAQRPLYDVAKQERSLCPITELQRHLQARVFMPKHHGNVFTEAERRFLDFNFWLSHNQRYDTDYAGARLLSEEKRSELQKLVSQLHKRYEASAASAFAINQTFAKRFQTLYFYLWHTVLALNVERQPEFEYFCEWMSAACCPLFLENISLCVKLLAGQWVDDRDSFLAKLRPQFANALTRVQNKVVTCNCKEEGLPNV